MHSKSEVLEKKIVKLNQKHLSKVNALVPSNLNFVLTNKARHKLIAVFALQVWLEQYHLQIPIGGLENLGDDLFQLLCLSFTTHLKLGNFKVCVVLCENEEEDILDIPVIAVELPKLASHLYIFVSLREEETNANSIDNQTSIQANILGFVRHDQIRERKLDIDYDETLKSYSVPLTNLEPSFSALHTCIRYVNPDKVVVPSSLHYPVSGLVTARTITEKMMALAPCTSWLAELFTGEELNYILDDKKSRENLLEKRVLSKPILPKINLYEWFQEIINDKQSNLLTPRKFVGNFRGTNDNLAEEKIREFIALKEIPENKSKLQSNEINIGSLICQYITVTWPKFETQLHTGVNFCLLLIPLNQKYLPNGISVTIQQSPFPDEVYKNSEFDLYYDLILDLDLQNEIKIILNYKEATYQQEFIYLEN
ncbi:hypothetical protein Lepto7376_1613 [[Leptolyngbya] sp. PCC 7376]|uniref:DUF1822 family protein n=1 Tax=[Leptolyngbya] sp. PCC 7376 TaxID=111781 RepID=UPI00029ED116|nr:DUF1822 family protein [[Leptolyngbya] sp. PCC 7376]AFY37949.1 hypothetical protein Lepto7376_1613 [[Leptolyngbya] sp. PCC 7376]